MLKPLEQFICDTCHHTIESVGDGWVEWLDEFKPFHRAHCFRICHIHGKSPVGGRCQKHSDDVTASDTYLSSVTTSAPAFLYAFLGTGHLHEEAAGQNQITNMIEFLDFARRLTIPYYDEARQFWSDALADGMLDGRHEISAYEPSFLREIILRFGPFDRQSEGDNQPALKPLSPVAQQLADRLFKALKDDPLTNSGRIADALVAIIESLGLEINERVGPSGMTAVFDYLEPSLTEMERGAIDRTWNGIGGWMT